MTNEEALRQLGVGAGQVITYEAIEVARKALEEKVELEKAEKKTRIPLHHIASSCRAAGDGYTFFFREAVSQAADIIQALNNVVIPELRKSPDDPWRKRLLSALGELP